MTMTKVEQAPKKGNNGSTARRKASSRSSTRIRKQRPATQADGKKEPLRRRILESLAEESTNPSSLAKRVESTSQPTVRILRKLLKESLVEASDDVSDRRLKIYELTVEGEVHLNELRAGRIAPPERPDLDHEETLVLLERAFERAVDMRRGSNQLDESKDRFEAVIREAEKIEEYDLALKAMGELTKTLRQSREPDAADSVIDRLNAISLGAEPGYDASLALPAAAHYSYSLGRLGDRRGDDLPAREEHLKTAYSLYQQLARNGNEDSVWLCQRSWSLVALATNLRKQTKLERALLYALTAKRGFDEVEDEYGSAICSFTFGFCLRLLGEFRVALACFDHAYEIASRKAFDRVRANSLMQLGDVLRSRGDVADARVLLNEALEQADRMGLVITQAFAYSALGAVEFQEQNLLEAGDLLDQAQEIFDRCDHIQGKALNNRRRATVARQIATSSSQPRYSPIESWINTAFLSYQNLASPAGIAACQIENGRVQMLRKNGKVKPTVKRLWTLLDDRASCTILKLDPWVPKLLYSFAKEVEDSALVEATHRVYEDAQSVLAEHADQSLRWLDEIGPPSDPDDGWYGLGDGPGAASIAEMGGETRRNMASLEERQILEPGSFEGKLLEDSVLTR